MGDYGKLNCVAIEIILKDLMRHAIAAIRKQRFSFTLNKKESTYKQKPADVVTSADQEAQEIYVTGIQNCFPDWGIIGEENELRKPSKNGIWITIDPVDGTKAFARKQSHGVGSMIAVFKEKQILMAYVGDVFSQDIFGFRFEAPTAELTIEFSSSIPLEYQEKKLKEADLLLSNKFERYSGRFQSWIKKFRSYKVEWDSIGIRFTRLWSGEVQALAFNFRYFTPWDAYPVLGISQHMGFKTFTLDENTNELIPFKINLAMEPYRINQEIIVLHQSFYQNYFA